jgi:predicted ester cyclase
MSNDETRAIARQVMERLDQRDLDGVYSYYEPSATFYGWAPQPLDTAGNRQAMTALLEAFPDSRFLIEDLIVSGDTAAIRHRFQGTQRGEYQNIPATGKRVDITGIVILKVKNGKVVEGYLNADSLGLLQQLGVIPVQSA